MILADYLSRHCDEDEDPADLIPFSFCRLRDVDTFCIGTRTSIRASGEKVPEIHGADKTLNPHKKPEHQNFGKGATPKKSVCLLPIRVPTLKHQLPLSEEIPERSQVDPVNRDPF